MSFVYYTQRHDGFSSKVVWQASTKYDAIIKMIPSEIINVRAYQKQKGETLFHRPPPVNRMGFPLT